MTETPEVDILIEDDRWMALGIQALAESAIGTVMAELGGNLSPVVSILATDDQKITALNAEFREKPQPTNVLSWPSEDLSATEPGEQPDWPSDPEIGDIALAYETCVKEAEAAGIALSDHVTHLIMHGVLHLLGYDHINDMDAMLMEMIEIKALETLGIANPYL